mmetsp:Transcript_66999/g.185560  ORF Transcript_66999/g.185560 Transcript_66999/m.185560 type:complete len:284 (+) Transcript_66999:746-1597(+)
MTRARGASTRIHSSCARSSWNFVPRWSKNTSRHERWPNSSAARRARSRPMPGHTSTAQERPARSTIHCATALWTGSTSKLTTCTTRGCPASAASLTARSARRRAVVPTNAPYSTTTSAPRVGREPAASTSLSARLPAIFRYELSPPRPPASAKAATVAIRPGTPPTSTSATWDTRPASLLCTPRGLPLGAIRTSNFMSTSRGAAGRNGPRHHSKSGTSSSKVQLNSIHCKSCASRRASRLKQKCARSCPQLSGSKARPCWPHAWKRSHPHSGSPEDQAAQMSA